MTCVDTEASRVNKKSRIGAHCPCLKGHALLGWGGGVAPIDEPKAKVTHLSGTLGPSRLFLA